MVRNDIIRETLKFLKIKNLYFHISDIPARSDCSSSTFCVGLLQALIILKV